MNEYERQWQELKTGEHPRTCTCKGCTDARLIRLKSKEKPAPRKPAKHRQNCGCDNCTSLRSLLAEDEPPETVKPEPVVELPKKKEAPKPKRHPVWCECESCASLRPLSPEKTEAEKVVQDAIERQANEAPRASVVRQLPQAPTPVYRVTNKRRARKKSWIPEIALIASGIAGLVVMLYSANPAFKGWLDAWVLYLRLTLGA